MMRSSEPFQQAKNMNNMVCLRSERYATSSRMIEIQTK